MGAGRRRGALKHILYIAFYFPPDGGAGTQRSLKFCKYLPALGWLPIVLTRESGRQKHVMEAEDVSFLEELPSEVSVIRVSEKGRQRGNGFRTSDISESYLQSFYDEAIRVLQTQKVDIILITMSPFGLARIGTLLQSRFRVPVIYDLRDPWALDGWRTYRTRFHWYADRHVMRRTLGKASGIVANTNESAKAIRKLICGLSKNPRMTVIPNGYDSQDFKDIGAIPTRKRIESEFKVVHAGTLHTSQLYPSGSMSSKLKRMLRVRPEPIVPDGRTEYFLYRAIKILSDEGHPIGKKFRFVCVGQNSEANTRCAKEAGLLNRVSFTGYVSHQESIEWLAQADALFLPLHDLPSGYRSLIVPGKTYEYLAANRPILAALPPGDARDLVGQSTNGFIASPCDPSSMARCLKAIFEQRISLETQNLPPTWLCDFERKALTGKLVKFLETVLIGSSKRTSVPLEPIDQLPEHPETQERRRDGGVG